MRCTKRTPIDDDAENAVIRPLEACVSLSTEGSVGVQGAIRLSPVNSPVFCVILSQRTSGTLPSSALKTGEFPRAEVAESKMS